METFIFYARKSIVYDVHLSIIRICLSSELQSKQCTIATKEFCASKNYFILLCIGHKEAIAEQGSFDNVLQFQLVLIIHNGKVKASKARVVRKGNIQCDFLARCNCFCHSLNSDSRRTAVISASCHSRGDCHCEHYRYGKKHR